MKSLWLLRPDNIIERQAKRLTTCRQGVFLVHSSRTVKCSGSLRPHLRCTGVVFDPLQIFFRCGSGAFTLLQDKDFMMKPEHTGGGNKRERWQGGRISLSVRGC